MKNHTEIGGWCLKAKTSRHLNKYMVYVLFCYNEYESFIKIGKTFRQINQRYSSKKELPYNYFIIETYNLYTPLECNLLEQKLQKRYKKYKYNPSKYFAGYTECFSTDILTEL